MQQLFEKFYRKIAHVEMDFQRDLLHSLDWENRLIGIKGARGTGKTTLLLQRINQIAQEQQGKILYASLDDLYFSEKYAGGTGGSVC